MHVYLVEGTQAARASQNAYRCVLVLLGCRPPSSWSGSWSAHSERYPRSSPEAAC